MRENNDDELFDMFMLGMLDDHSGGKSPHKGGGCLMSFLLIVTFPIISIIGVCVMLA